MQKKNDFLAISVSEKKSSVSAVNLKIDQMFRKFPNKRRIVRLCIEKLLNKDKAVKVSNL